MWRRVSESFSKWRRQCFRALLDNYNIGTNVPAAYGPDSGHLCDVPDSSSPRLVTVGGDETQIQPVPPPRSVELDDLRLSYYVQAVKSVAMSLYEQASDEEDEEE